MIDAIRASFKKGLPNLDWMDDKTRRAAEDKVMLIDLLIDLPNCHSGNANIPLNSCYVNISIDRPTSLFVCQYHSGQTNITPCWPLLSWLHPLG